LLGKFHKIASVVQPGQWVSARQLGQIGVGFAQCPCPSPDFAFQMFVMPVAVNCVQNQNG